MALDLGRLASARHFRRHRRVTAGRVGSFNPGNPGWLTVQVILATISTDSVDFTDIGGIIGC
ncbi:MAG: hypothetical protein ABI127_04260 [Dokdonella sp.]